VATEILFIWNSSVCHVLRDFVLIYALEMLLLLTYGVICFQKCYVDLESSNAARRRLETELSSAESDHRLAVVEYRRRVEELSIELRTLQVVVEEQKGCGDEAATLALELEKEKGRLAGLCCVISVNC